MQKKSCPVILNDLYKPKPSTKYRLRNDGVLLEPYNKTKSSDFCISYRGPHLWNKLLSNHEDVIQCDQFFLFKEKLKNLILSIDDVTEYY